MRRRTVLPFEIEQAEAPWMARGGLVLPYEMAKALRVEEVTDREMPSPDSGQGYKPSQFVMPLILMLHGRGRKLDDLRELKGKVSLRELLEARELPAPCTVGDWLRRMGKDGRGLCGLGKVNQHMVAEILKRDTNRFWAVLVP